jgi:hypothetical protein
MEGAARAKGGLVFGPRQVFIRERRTRQLPEDSLGAPSSQISLIDDNSKLPVEPGPNDLLCRVTFLFQECINVIRGPAPAGSGEFEGAFQGSCVRGHGCYLQTPVRQATPQLSFRSKAVKSIVRGRAALQCAVGVPLTMAPGRGSAFGSRAGSRSA